MTAKIYTFPTREVMHRVQAERFATRALEDERNEELRCARQYMHAAIDAYRAAGDEDTACMLEAYAYQIDLNRD